MSNKLLPYHTDIMCLSCSINLVSICENKAIYNNIIIIMNISHQLITTDYLLHFELLS